MRADDWFGNAQAGVAAVWGGVISPRRSWMSGVL